MASSFVETQITWSSASSITLSAATRADSDAMTLDPETHDGELQISVHNQGTPASGDILDVFIKRSSGDILGDSADDYDTDEHATFLCRLDTFSSNNPGENPARTTVPLPTGCGKFKLSIESPNAATRNMVVRARMVEHRVA